MLASYESDLVRYYCVLATLGMALVVGPWIGGAIGRARGRELAGMGWGLLGPVGWIVAALVLGVERREVELRTTAREVELRRTREKR